MDITEICNMALARIGKAGIASIKENSENARQCALFYDFTRKKLLREYAWGFAKRTIKAAELSAESPYWAHIYAYPQYCIAIRKIFSEGDAQAVNEGKEQEPWDLHMVSDGVLGIGCNVEKAWIEYTYDVLDADLFSADFLEALVHMLAFNICQQLTGSAGMQQTEYQLAMNAITAAKFGSAKEKKQKPVYPTSYIDGRG